jgi:prefoldin subunit 5
MTVAHEVEAIKKQIEKLQEEMEELLASESEVDEKRDTFGSNRQRETSLCLTGCR